MLVAVPDVEEIVCLPLSSSEGTVLRVNSRVVMPSTCEKELSEMSVEVLSVIPSVSCGDSDWRDRGEGEGRELNEAFMLCLFSEGRRRLRQPLERPWRLRLARVQGFSTWNRNTTARVIWRDAAFKLGKPKQAVALLVESAASRPKIANRHILVNSIPSAKALSVRAALPDQARAIAVVPVKGSERRGTFEVSMYSSTVPSSGLRITASESTIEPSSENPIDNQLSCSTSTCVVSGVTVI